MCKTLFQRGVGVRSSNYSSGGLLNWIKFSLCAVCTWERLNRAVSKRLVLHNLAVPSVLFTLLLKSFIPLSPFISCPPFTRFQVCTPFFPLYFSPISSVLSPPRPVDVFLLVWPQWESSHHQSYLTPLPLSCSDLSGNPYECDCKLFRLVSWLQEKGVQVRRPEAMLCDHPANLRHQPLLNISLLTCGTKRICTDTETYFISLHLRSFI